jgi:predicted GNAT family N-acyltransferase
VPELGPEIKQVAFSDPAFAHCFRIRLEVFVAEQNVPLEEERDEYDNTALHFLAMVDGIATGTARVVLKDADATAKISRVAVSKSARRLGIGAALIRHIESAVDCGRFLLDAQTHALVFYERLGYAIYGEAFMEAGIPHRHMQKTRPASSNPFHIQT